jgi:hypothetical protein
MLGMIFGRDVVGIQLADLFEFQTNLLSPLAVTAINSMLIHPIIS